MAGPGNNSAGRTRADAAAMQAAAAGIPIAPAIPFYRMGEPFRIPVGPDTADDPFPIDLSVFGTPPTAFQYTNNNPFAVRLRGTRAGRDFVPVSSTTGWLWLPGSQGIRTTLVPALLSAMSVDGPYAATSPEQRAGVGFIELQYGTGGNG